MGPNDTRERSARKILQNNMVLQMNAMFLKVLEEVLLGPPIMEPNVKRGNRIKRRKPGTKRVPSRNRLTRFRCHSAVYQRERERERENKITTRYKEIERSDSF